VFHYKFEYYYVFLCLCVEKSVIFIESCMWIVTEVCGICLWKCIWYIILLFYVFCMYCVIIVFKIFCINSKKEPSFSSSFLQCLRSLDPFTYRN
jgi:hypothetical protein